MYPGNPKVVTYNKPIIYIDQATIQTVNAGMPYYVASPKYGYEGEYIPVAGSVSSIANIDSQTGELNPASYDTETNLWVTCTASRYQCNRPFRRCSLLDAGVMHNTYSPRMAFTNMFSALYYAETGKLK